VGKRDDPRKTGPHLRDRIFNERHSSIGSVQSLFETDRPYAKFLLEGTSRHRVPKSGNTLLAWLEGGEWAYSMGHMVSGIKPNRFNERAWAVAEGAVMDELVVRLSEAFDV
jgi:hypothetical protein